MLRRRDIEERRLFCAQLEGCWWSAMSSLPLFRLSEHTVKIVGYEDTKREAKERKTVATKNRKTGSAEYIRNVGS